MTKVSLLTHSYLDGYNRNYARVFGGGLERYIHDLCLLLQDMGCTPVVHQLSFFEDFDSVVDGIEVHGYTYRSDRIAEAFERITAPIQGPLIYASCLWHPIRYRPGSIGICHGINWDNPLLDAQAKRTVAESIQGAIDQLTRIVTVDSHFQTYCRSVCQYEDSSKLALIPNSVDTRYFTPGEPEKSPAIGLIKVLYPRRLSPERGILQMMQIADRLLASNPSILMEFAGERVEGSPIGDAFPIWRQSHPHRERIRHRTYGFSEVRAAYRGADIAVIPTIYSEGTSYSCLEAMSCGLPVVSTDVGGLNDLVIDGFNGRIVPPRKEELYEAIMELAENRELRTTMGRRARETALSFDLSIWRRRWRKVLEAYLPPLPGTDERRN
ncbi:glycosyltransferase family 4 protein [Cohnella sp. AR92]|uniref:glycosyltransferase family 4 protein n=1 Tax=Cohnella sp. AR92 TaxID=648716 RepID=UPI000F8E26A4|nr:glycosyltransferase family 4 protein [Cohnella sp. AR92]RUS49114.1 glycosyltransferase [Cohnella sp. AR92]